MRGLSIFPLRQHTASQRLKEKPRRGPGLSYCISAEERYSCPYFRSTSRHELPTRQLWAASVAPHRSKLLQVMPAERSHSRAAAGLHGASSARSTAPALVLKAPTIRHAASTVFITESPLFIFGRGRWLAHYGGKSQDFVRRTKAASEEKQRRRKPLIWNNKMSAA